MKNEDLKREIPVINRIFKIYINCQPLSTSLYSVTNSNHCLLIMKRPVIKSRSILYKVFLVDLFPLEFNLYTRHSSRQGDIRLICPSHYFLLLDTHSSILCISYSFLIPCIYYFINLVLPTIFNNFFSNRLGSIYKFCHTLRGTEGVDEV